MTDRYEERAEAFVAQILRRLNWCGPSRFAEVDAARQLTPYVAQVLHEAAAEARADENEGCAKVADGFTGHQDEDLSAMDLPTQGECVAAAIRARMDKEPRK